MDLGLFASVRELDFWHFPTDYWSSKRRLAPHPLPHLRTHVSNSNFFSHLGARHDTILYSVNNLQRHSPKRNLIFSAADQAFINFIMAVPRRNPSAKKVRMNLDLNQIVYFSSAELPSYSSKSSERVEVQSFSCRWSESSCEINSRCSVPCRPVRRTSD
jgi:hypothetical protein